MTGLHLPGPGDRVLVCAPHQDDESIGCGGAVRRWRDQGTDVGVLWMSADDSGAAVGPEARQALAVLGVEWCRSLGRPAVGLTYDHATVTEVVHAMRAFGPTVVLVPHPDEDDRQHQVTSELATEASWLVEYPWQTEVAAVPAPRLVLAYEVWTPMRRPTTYLDISSTATRKQSAIDCYASQTRIVPYGEAALGLNRYRGRMFGVGEYAEALTYLSGMS